MKLKLSTSLIALALAGGLSACDNGSRDSATAPKNDNAIARKEDREAARSDGGAVTEPNRTTQRHERQRAGTGG